MLAAFACLPASATASPSSPGRNVVLSSLIGAIVLAFLFSESPGPADADADADSEPDEVILDPEDTGPTAESGLGLPTTVEPEETGSMATVPGSEPPISTERTRLPGKEAVDTGEVPMTYGIPYDGMHSRSIFVSLLRIGVLVAAVGVMLRAVYCVTFVTNDQTRWHSSTGVVLGIALVAIAVSIFLPPVPATIILLGGCAGPFALSFQAFQENRPDDRKSFWQTISNQVQFTAIPERAGELEIEPGVRIGGSQQSITLVGKSALLDVDESRPIRSARESHGMRMAIALIDHAIANRATDLHVNYRSGKVVFRKRVDGTLSSIGQVDGGVGLATINIFKVLADCNIADRRRAQDGSFRAEVNGRRLSFRVSSQGTQTGETLSIRILDPATTFSSLESVGMPEDIRDRFAAQLNRNHGLILVAGNTGAGKSTTACAAMQTLAKGERYLVSVEDPIEYEIDAVDQIEVNHRAGMTFESGLRSLVRMDADVILIGEIRDQVSAQIACQAAMSGQLVIATIHAGFAGGAVARLVDLGVDVHNVSSCLRAVLAQSLVRKLCTRCRVAYTPNSSVIEQLGCEDFSGQLHKSTVSLSDPCPRCDGRGFLRRTGVFELMEIDKRLRNDIFRRVSPSDLQIAAIQNGMSTLWNEGMKLVRQGVVSFDEIDRVLDSP